MVRFVNPQPAAYCGRLVAAKRAATNLEKIIEFLTIHYSRNEGTGDGGDYIPTRNRFILDIRMMGDIVNENPYTILLIDDSMRHTSIITCRNITVAKIEAKKYLNGKDGFRIAHIFHCGLEIYTHIEITFVSKDYN